MVIGNSGAGKTELGRLFAARLSLPFADLDDEHWLAGWRAPEEGNWRRRHKQLIAPEAWLLAGNFGSTIDLRARAADLVVLIIIPPALGVWRLLMRSVKIRLGRQVWRLPRERRAGPDWEPLRDYPAFLRYAWRWRRESEHRARTRLRDAGVGQIINLRSSAQVRLLTRELEASSDPSAALGPWLTALPE